MTLGEATGILTDGSVTIVVGRIDDDSPVVAKSLTGMTALCPEPLAGAGRDLRRFQKDCATVLGLPRESLPCISLSQLLSLLSALLLPPPSWSFFGETGGVDFC